MRRDPDQRWLTYRMRGRSAIAFSNGDSTGGAGRLAYVPGAGGFHVLYRHGARLRSYILAIAS